MTLQEKMTSYLQMFEAHLELFIKECEHQIPKNLYEPEVYILKSGGKRIRPVLALLASDLVSGKPEQALPVATAIELFHHFTLVHDDIMDEAPTRRGKPTIHHKWNIPSAILSGDLMMIHAMQQFNFLPEKMDYCLKRFLETAEAICQGQQMDMDMEQSGSTELKTYLEMIRKKTAILLGCSMELGAVAGGKTEHDAVLFYDFAVELGTCFQIQDDFLDTFGEEQITGKLQGGDLLRGKKSLPYILSENLLTGKAREEWEHFKKIPLSEKKKKLPDILHVLSSEGIKEECQKKATEFSQLSNRCIEKIHFLSDSQKNILRELSLILLSRKK